MLRWYPCDSVADRDEELCIFTCKIKTVTLWQSNALWVFSGVSKVFQEAFKGEFQSCGQTAQQRHSMKCQWTTMISWISQRTKKEHIPSLILTLFILDTIRTMIKNLKGKATLLVRSQAEIERRWIFFACYLFFTGTVWNVDDNWTESKRIKTHQCLNRKCARFKV